MKTSQELEVELAALGDSSEAVANALRSMGIKGRRRETCQCPLANYLRNISGEKIRVGYQTAGFVESNDRSAIRMPNACQNFIYNFDTLCMFSDLRAQD